MNDLVDPLTKYIEYKLKTDPLWFNLTVILSDSQFPGEGEHKFMNFIRNQNLSLEKQNKL